MDAGNNTNGKQKYDVEVCQERVIVKTLGQGEEAFEEFYVGRFFHDWMPASWRIFGIRIGRFRPAKAGLEVDV